MIKIPEELKRVKQILQETEGLPSDNNHDPSNVIFYNGCYYLWYTQHRNDRPYDHLRIAKYVVQYRRMGSIGAMLGIPCFPQRMDGIVQGC